jgi:hypothetical protein
MKTTQVTGIFVLLLSLFVATGHVSSNPAQEQEIGLAQSDERYVQDAHLARYREHLAELRIDRFSCR